MSYSYNFPKIATTSIQAQCLKIREEATEVEAEAVALRLAEIREEPKDYKALVIETLDYIHAGESMLNHLLDIGAVSQRFIDEAKVEVIRKNKDRGYYEEAK